MCDTHPHIRITTFNMHQVS